MKDDYKNNLESNVEDVNESINVSETKNVKKEIVINMKYVKVYLRCLLFSFLTVLLVTLATCHFKYEDGSFVYQYAFEGNDHYDVYNEIYSPEQLISCATCYSIFSDEIEVYKCDGIYRSYYRISDSKIKMFSRDSQERFFPLEKGLVKNNPINHIYLFFKYVLYVFPFYYFILISLIYIPILWFFKRYRFKFK